MKKHLAFLDKDMMEFHEKQVYPVADYLTDSHLKNQICRIKEDLITDLVQRLEDGADIDFSTLISKGLVIEPIGSLSHLIKIKEGESHHSLKNYIFSCCETYTNYLENTAVDSGPKGLYLDILCYSNEEAMAEKLYQKMAHLLRGRDRNCL